MKPKSIATLVILGLLASFASGCQNSQVSLNTTPSQANANAGIIFACEQDYQTSEGEYVYSTFAWNPQNKKAIVHWETKDFTDYPPKRRCELVTPRFQEAYDKGNLDYVTYGTMNDQPVLCTAKQEGGECETLLITLRHSDDPVKSLEYLLDVMASKTTGPLVQKNGKPYFNAKEALNELLNE